MSQNIGKIISAKGPVIDIQFNGDSNLPALNTAIEIQNGDELLVVEVAQHIGDDIVRCIAMGPTDGVRRGMDAVDTKHPITVPVGNTKETTLIPVSKISVSVLCSEYDGALR